MANELPSWIFGVQNAFEITGRLDECLYRVLVADPFHVSKFPIKGTVFFSSRPVADSRWTIKSSGALDLPLRRRQKIAQLQPDVMENPF